MINGEERGRKKKEKGEGAIYLPIRGERMRKHKNEGAGERSARGRDFVVIGVPLKKGDVIVRVFL